MNTNRHSQASFSHLKVKKLTLPHVGGIPVHLHFLPSYPRGDGLMDSLPVNLPAAFAFLLHGRRSDSQALDSMAAALVRRCAQAGHEGEHRRNLVVVTLDHRNHGHRCVHDLANHAWSGGNPTHAQDMLSIQYGTAQDVSMLVSLLPAYLPAALRVELWACLGVSLGGHATWLALLHDPRITVGVPILGCCDFLALMRQRLRHIKEEQGGTKPGAHEAAGGVSDGGTAREGEEEQLPDALKSAVDLLDAAGMGQRAVERLKDRKILVLSRAHDWLVPHVCSQPFIEQLQFAMAAAPEGGGVCEVIAEPGKAHKVSEAMETAAGDWLARWACVAPAHGSRL